MQLTQSTVNPKLTKTIVYTELQKDSVVSPKIATQIAVLESGLHPTNNNLFGFRKKHYLKFATWKLATDYFKRWEDKKYYAHLDKYHKDDTCDYYHFIKAIGYVDGVPFSKANDRYVDKLKKISL